MREATRLLRALGRSEDMGSPDAERLWALVYGKLRRLANALFDSERADHTLEPTAVANEAYLKLIRQDRVSWQDEAHFLAIAAQAMRRVLVDHERARRSLERGEEWERVEMESRLLARDRSERLDVSERRRSQGTWLVVPSGLLYLRWISSRLAAPVLGDGCGESFTPTPLPTVATMLRLQPPLSRLVGCSLLGLSVVTSATAQDRLTSNGQPLRPVSVSPPVHGTASSPLFFSEDSSGILWTLDPSTGAATNVGASGVVSATVGLSSRDANTLYGTIWDDTNIIQADGSGSVFFGDAAAEGLAYHEASDTLFGTVNGTFFEIDTTTGDVGSSLGAPPGDVEGIAWGNGGVYGLVGFASSDTNLYWYDPNTNAWTLVGDTGIDWDLVGLAHDPGNDVLYAKGSQDSNLYRIDPTNGSTVLVGDTGLAAGGGLAWLETGGPIGTNYCGPANTNSSGQSAVISAFGSTSAAANDVRLDAAQMATNQFGMFVTSMTQGFFMPPGSQGNLCLSSPGGYKANIMSTGPTGEFSLQLDLTKTPTPGGPVAIQPGETWNFQAWFRDDNPNATSNFTDGIEIQFD